MSYSSKTKINTSSTWLSWLAVFVILEILSWFSFHWPILNLAVLILVGLLTFILVLWNNIFAIYIPLAELFWGSLGHSFDYNFVSLRMVIFVMIILFFLLRYINKIRQIKFVHDRKMFFIWLLIVLFFIFSAIWPYFKKVELQKIFFDANAYLYIFYLPVWYQFFKRKYLNNILIILQTSALIVAVKTLLVFNIFVQDYSLIDTESIYKWIRDSRTGEITPFADNFYRVFMQSQFYLLVAWFVAFVKQLREYTNRLNFLYIITISAALLVSLSRSIWLGGVVGLLFLILSIFIFQKRGFHFVIYLSIIGIALGSVVLVEGFYNLPKYNRIEIWNQRTVDTGESAISSRQQLLKPMWDGIKSSPIIGHGFGKEITYQSSDPRIKNQENPEGWYTTYSFEWGWLDIWLKAGIGMMILFISWILIIFGRGYKMLISHPATSFALLASVASLITIHIFTPYINHPLGLGLLMITTVIFSTYEKRTISYY